MNWFSTGLSDLTQGYRCLGLLKHQMTATFHCNQIIFKTFRNQQSKRFLFLLVTCRFCVDLAHVLASKSSYWNTESFRLCVCIFNPDCMCTLHPACEKLWILMPSGNKGKWRKIFSLGLLEILIQTVLPRSVHLVQRITYLKIFHMEGKPILPPTWSS